MEGRLIFKNATLVERSGGVRPGCAMVVDGERIARVDEDGALPVLPGDWAIDCDGRAVVPARTTTLSALAAPWRGLGDSTALARHCVLEAVLRGVGLVELDAENPLAKAIAAFCVELGLTVSPAALVVGMQGSVAVLEAWPAAELGAALALAQTADARCGWLVAKGRVLVREGQLVGFDGAATAQAAMEAAVAWSRAQVR